MPEGLYLVKSLTPEQVASVIATVTQHESNLTWRFRFHRKITQETVQNAKTVLQQNLIDLGSFVKDTGLPESDTLVTEVEDVHVYVDPKRLLGSRDLYPKIQEGEYPDTYLHLSEAHVNEIYFFVDPQRVLTGNIAKVARSGLQEASAQTLTAQSTTGYRAELSIRGGPEEFVMNVSDNRSIWRPEGRPFGDWIHPCRDDESTQCCKILYDLLKDI